MPDVSLLLLRVLIVEDDEDLRLILKLLLKHQHGFEVSDARNAEQGIELAQREKPDLILMDLTLPQMDGFEAISILRASPETKDVGIIVVSDLCWEIRTKQQTRYYGCLGCVDKAHLLEDLPPLIAAAVAKTGVHVGDQKLMIHQG